MIKIKSGVTPANLLIAAAIANVAQIEKLELVITSGTDGRHMNGSKHYSGEALDVRISNLTKEQVLIVMASLKRRLGKDFQVILESDHLHVEHDLKQMP